MDYSILMQDHVNQIEISYCDMVEIENNFSDTPYLELKVPREMVVSYEKLKKMDEMDGRQFWKDCGFSSNLQNFNISDIVDDCSKNFLGRILEMFERDKTPFVDVDTINSEKYIMLYVDGTPRELPRYFKYS